MFSDLTTLVLGVLGAILFTAIGIFFNWLFTRAELKKHPLPAEGACVACGSMDLDVLAPGVYRCRACGYEGGENRAAMEATEQQLAWEGRPWPERVAAARADLVDARRRLTAIEGEVETVRKGGVPTLLSGAVFSQNSAGYNQQARDERNNAFANLLGEIQASGAAVSSAALKVTGITPPVFEASSWGRIQAHDVLEAYETARAALMTAMGVVEALADSIQSAANEAAATDGTAKVDPT